MVHGKPYGVTRIYRCFKKQMKFEKETLPSVRVFDGRLENWGTIAGGGIDTPFSPAPPATYKVGYSSLERETTATETFRLSSQPGWLLIRLSFHNLSENGGVFSVNSQENVTEVMSELGAKFDSASIFPGNNEMYLIHHNVDETFFISFFNRAHLPSTLKRVTTYPIKFLKKNSMVADKVLFPPYSEWQPAGDKIIIEHEENGSIKVLGDDTAFGYQIWSPLISFPENALIEINLPVSQTDGGIAFGLLNETGDKWILPAVELKERYRVSVGNNTKMIAVIANYKPGPEAKGRTEFSAEPCGYTIFKKDKDDIYADRLLDILSK